MRIDNKKQQQKKTKNNNKKQKKNEKKKKPYPFKQCGGATSKQVTQNKTGE